MKVDVSEETGSDTWPPLPTDDRVLVGGHTVWTGPFRTPVIVPQPNRWGVIEGTFPDVECLVEADPLVTAHLPLPEKVVGFVDRAHRAIPAPPADDSGGRLMERAARLGKALTQVRGVRLAATPFARTLPLVTPRDPGELASECAGAAVTGLRPLDGLAGGVALSVRPEHGPDELDHLVAVMRAATGR